MVEISYRRHRFPPVIIQHAVWLYLRFTLSYRDVEELLAERGLDISYESQPTDRRSHRLRPLSEGVSKGLFVGKANRGGVASFGAGDLPPEKWTRGYAASASACCGVM